jgi:uncharacterized protein YeaO (DUF488 family)
MPQLEIRRVYAPPSPHEGRRVLVDRVWPRSLSKQDLEGVLWLKELGPSTELRKWFGHKPERWEEFRKRYFAELSTNPALKTVKTLIREGSVTLLYSAHDEEHNQAVALSEYLRQRDR